MEQEKRILLDCRDAALGYEGKPVWEHLNFQVHSGDYVCIVGENGSGKSTLVKSLLGLLHPMAGEIVRSPSLRSGAIGYLPQQTKAQKDFPATVTEVVRSGFLSGKGMRFFYTPKEKSTALMHMGKLGVLELKDRCYRELSGGQQQRVLLARARGTADPGRAGDGAGPGGGPGAVPHAGIPEQAGGHRHRGGDTRYTQCPALRRPYSARRPWNVLFRHGGGLSNVPLGQTVRR